MPTALAAPPRALQPKPFLLDPALREYSMLKARVNEVLILGQQRIEREFIRMRYQTGLLINEHVRLNEDRAAYGTQAVFKLGKDFEIDYSELQRYAQFARAYPIVGRGRQLVFNLPWKYYRKLMTIKDDGRRWALTAEAEKSGWPFEKVEARVRYVVGKDGKGKQPSRLPLVSLGPFYLYSVIRPETIHSRAKEFLLDLGFSQTLEMDLFPEARFPAETMVTSVRDLRTGRYSLVKAEGAAADCLYTYKAYVENVIDGDTLKVEFQLGFGNRRRETIRLNHIDCPELDTPEGRAAKKFVESELAPCEFVIVKSIRTRREKWGRYLGDVFYSKKEGAPPVYLNQLLLDTGHAVRLRI